MKPNYSATFKSTYSAFYRSFTFQLIASSHVILKHFDMRFIFNVNFMRYALDINAVANPEAN